MLREVNYFSTRVHVRRDMGFEEIAASEVVIGDEIEVRMGELLPIDATVLSGETKMLHRSSLDEGSAFFVSSGDAVSSGSINLGAPIRVLASADYNASKTQKLYQRYKVTLQRKSSTEIVFDRIGKVFTVCGIILSLVLGVLIPLLSGGDFLRWLSPALIVLSINCNDRFSTSVYYAYYCAISMFAKIGIIIKNKSLLDNFYKIRHVVFDKTGTLTEGVFSIKELVPHEGVTKEEMLRYAAMAECRSDHPVAKAILDAYGEIDFDKTVDHELEVPGEGICVAVRGERIYVGNYHLMDRAGIRYLPYYSDGVVIYVATETKYYGCIVLKDEIHASSFKTVDALYKMGVTTITMLTGDKKNNAENTAARLGLQRYFAELLPEDKVKQMKHIMEKNRTGGYVAFVGDGISDAPALSAADIGIAMLDDIPTDSAQSSDVIMLTNDPFGVAFLFGVSRKLHRSIFWNTVLVVAMKILVLVLVILGMLPLSLAVLMDGVCSLLMTAISWNVCKIKWGKN